MINATIAHWKRIMKLIEMYAPIIYAGITALGISALSDIRAGKSAIYTATGALICGIFAVAISALLEHMDLPANSGAFVGALVGFVGADRLRTIVLGLVQNKVGLLEDKNEKSSMGNKG
ncbi:phage holin family protein [Enterobacter roggenkampii]|uniref:phage holin family protein n=1 Tax=Enterobacter roggenkampii TaxID=1812935 RepID=UPI002FFCB424